MSFLVVLIIAGGIRIKHELRFHDIVMVVFAANIIFVIIILFCNSKGLWVYYCGMTEYEDVFSIYPATEFELK